MLPPSKHYLSVAHHYRLKDSYRACHEVHGHLSDCDDGTDKRRWRKGERFKRAVGEGIGRSWGFIGCGGLGN